MTRRRTVVVAGSRAGAILAGRIATALGEAEVHLPARWAGLVAGSTPLGEPLARALPRLFGADDVASLVVVLAVGATIRLLAPALRGKSLDPGVVAVDDAGRFAIALLSGHLGGANTLAERVAEATGGTAVITSGSDVAGVPSLDLLGADEGWRIESSGEDLRGATAAVLNGDPVGVYQNAGRRDWWPAGAPANVRALTDANEAGPDLAALLLISDQVLADHPGPRWRVTYRPPTLVAGVGCSRGATAEDIESAIRLALSAGRLAPGSLAGLATIDRRLDEPGLLLCADRLGLLVRGFSAEQLAAVGPLPTPSAVVQAAVGTPGVCEPAALLASGADHLAVPKVRTARATAAIARLQHA